MLVNFSRTHNYIDDMIHKKFTNEKCIVAGNFSVRVITCNGLFMSNISISSNTRSYHSSDIDSYYLLRKWYCIGLRRLSVKSITRLSYIIIYYTCRLYAMYWTDDKLWNMVHKYINFTRTVVLLLYFRKILRVLKLRQYNIVLFTVYFLN